jgi:microcystin degradation protein MlrC
LRIFTAALATETNTFSPIAIDRRAFEASLYAPPGKHPETPTLCTAPITVGRRVCKELGWELVEGTAAWADPAGLVNRTAYEGLRDEILAQLQAALPVDAVVFGLHGAMVAAGYDDPEGDFLTRARTIVGPDVPICAELDPHSHLTARRVAAADWFVAFKEFPHTDFVARAEDLWQLLVRRLRGEVLPAMSAFDCRMIDVFPTSREPMRGFVDRMMQIERDDPKILSISLIHGFMAGDVPEMGTKMIVVTDNDRAYGDALAERLGREVFALRGKVMMEQLGVEEVLDRAGRVAPGPVVIADMWDNPGGGTAGDATVILTAMLERGITDAAFGTIWDPVATQICLAAGVDAEIPLRFGAKSAPGTGNPIDRTVRIVRIVPDARMRFGSSEVPFGDCVVIAFDGVEVILNTTRAQCFDRSVFDVMGIDPTQKRYLVVKSTNHFHASFVTFASEILYCSAGSPYPNDPATNTYRKARRDIWPMVADPFTKA